MGLASKLAAAQASQGGAPGGAPQGAYGAPPAPPQSRPDPYGAPPSYGGAPPPQSSPYGAPSGPPPGQQQQYGAPPGAPPGQQPGQQQSQYGAPSGAPPGQSPYGAPPQQQQQPPYGQPPQQQQQYGQPPQQQQQYGQPPQGQQQQYPPPGQQPPPHQGGGGSMDPRQVEQILAQCVQEQKISSFYPPGSLSQIAQRVAASGAIEKVMAVWNIPRELAADLLKLSLFDIILLVDDSGSMAFEENGERIDDLKLILGRIAFVGALFDQDGIQVRFMNSNVQGNNINSEASAMNLLSQIKYSGLTPLGTSLDQKIIQPLVLGPAQQGRLQKPVLVITITDGTPAGEPRDQVFRVIQNAVSTLQRTRYGPDALSFQFAQVGNDMKAQAFLGEIDTHPQIGSLVDCTSNYEVESAEMQRKAGIELTPDMWIVKLALGGIDDSYDEKDERN